MFLFPLLPPWQYSPLGFAAAVIWNLGEIFRIRNPWAHVFFEKITGMKGIPIEEDDQ